MTHELHAKLYPGLPWRKEYSVLRILF